MEKGQKIQVKIEDISSEGQGIGHVSGMAVFVNDTVPGDFVEAEIIKLKKRFAVCRLVNLLEPSPDRIEPDCPYFEICGGCQFRNISYEAELAIKEKQVRDKITRLGEVEEPEIQNILAMARKERYRNKGRFSISTGGFLTEKGGRIRPVTEPKIGYYSYKSHKICDIDDCLLQSPAASAAIAAVKRYMLEDNIPSFDERWGKGLMRQMTVKTAEDSAEVMVILEITGRGMPNAEKLVSYLDDYIYEAGYNLESVVLNRKTMKVQAAKSGKQKNEKGGAGAKQKTKNVEAHPRQKFAAGPDDYQVLAGRPVIKSRMGELEFEISASAFYQVNPVQAERLYEKAIEYAGLRGDEIVYDLYCGVGTIGLFAAKAMAAKVMAACADAAIAARDGSDAAMATRGYVYGIELDKSAVLDANRNAVINGIVNAEFICGKAEEKIDDLLEKGRPDVVFVDPPRSGCDKTLLETLAKVSPEKIVYISCDPATLARDIKTITASGYEFVEATPVDMFPRCGHVETVVLMSKK